MSNHTIRLSFFIIFFSSLACVSGYFYWPIKMKECLREIANESIWYKPEKGLALPYELCAERIGLVKIE